MRNPQDPQSPQLPLYKEILRILSKLRKIERKYKCICDFLSLSNFGAAKYPFQREDLHIPTRFTQIQRTLLMDAMVQNNFHIAKPYLLILVR